MEKSIVIRLFVFPGPILGRQLTVCLMPLEDLIDKDKEIERLTKETERLTKEIARCEGMLNNPNFVNKAPAAKVDAEKDKLAKYKEMMDKVKGQLEQLKK